MSLPDPGLFHFLRPAWLLLILPALLLWWQVRRADRPGDPRYDGIAPHLARALTVGLERRERLLPIDGVLAIACLLALGAAGPTWSRAENPFLAQTAPLVVVLEVSESMEASDIAPTRLERAKQKIADLLALRSGGRTALVAYAGSAHRVAPLTRDAAVLKPFLDGLDPKVMPRPGENATAALTLARSIIAGEPTPGAILWLADGIAPADRAAFAGRDAAAGALLLALPMTAEPGGGASFSDAGLSVVSLTPDTADIRRIDRRIARAWQRAQAEDGSEAWEDRGPLLAWPAALLCLLWFRRGWTMRWDGRSHGMAATFMAKPFYEESGNGFHVHHSLLKDGANAFADGGKLSQTGMAYMAGVQKRMIEASLCGTMTPNGYRRFQPFSFCP
ncbi:MAG: VWA domain-containing protein, partial [Pseudomonadota bacterium]